METNSVWLLALTIAVGLLVPIAILASGYNVFRRRISWKDEIVLVTGGSQGVGCELVQQILSKCNPRHVVIVDVKNPSHMFPKDRVTFFQCDISEFSNVEKLARLVSTHIGQPTIVVNNAGTLAGKRFTDLEPAEIERVIKVNLFGAIWITKVFLPDMLEKNHGHILNVCSALSLSGSAGVSAYCASKFGLSGFSESLTQELKNTNVHVSAIYPGLISTTLFSGVSYKYSLFPKLTANYVATVMLWILENDASVEIVTPLIANGGRAMKLFPVLVQGWIKDMIGANSSMDSYNRQL
ncbi:hypothetical protein HDU78_008027 [Chytriomyces hyalinus]|nr:hypothetical protein HDU78_008027 [Chytriomyces hyalinus]